MTTPQLPAVGSAWQWDPIGDWPAEKIIVTGTGEGHSGYQVRIQGPIGGERWVDLANFTGPAAVPHRE